MLKIHSFTDGVRQGMYCSPSTLWPLLLLVPSVVSSGWNPLSPFAVEQISSLLSEASSNVTSATGPPLTNQPV